MGEEMRRGNGNSSAVGVRRRGEIEPRREQNGGNPHWRTGAILSLTPRGRKPRTCSGSQAITRTFGSKAKWERDIGLTLGDICRLRINVYRERGNIGLVMRIISLDIMTLDELEMPPILKDVSMSPQGLVLVTGPTGCGKSTTLAAMMNRLSTCIRTSAAS